MVPLYYGHLQYKSPWFRGTPYAPWSLNYFLLLPAPWSFLHPAPGSLVVLDPIIRAHEGGGQIVECQGQIFAWKCRVSTWKWECRVSTLHSVALWLWGRVSPIDSREVRLEWKVHIFFAFWRQSVQCWADFWMSNVFCLSVECRIEKKTMSGVGKTPIMGTIFPSP